MLMGQQNSIQQKLINAHPQLTQQGQILIMNNIFWITLLVFAVLAFIPILITSKLGTERNTQMFYHLRLFSKAIIFQISLALLIERLEVNEEFLGLATYLQEILIVATLCFSILIKSLTRFTPSCQCLEPYEEFQDEAETSPKIMVNQEQQQANRDSRSNRSVSLVKLEQPSLKNVGFPGFPQELQSIDINMQQLNNKVPEESASFNNVQSIDIPKKNQMTLDINRVESKMPSFLLPNTQRDSIYPSGPTSQRDSRVPKLSIIQVKDEKGEMRMGVFQTMEPDDIEKQLGLKTLGTSYMQFGGQQHIQYGARRSTRIQASKRLSELDLQIVIDITHSYASSDKNSKPMTILYHDDGVNESPKHTISAPNIPSIEERKEKKESESSTSSELTEEEEEAVSPNADLVLLYLATYILIIRLGVWCALAENVYDYALFFFAGFLHYWLGQIYLNDFNGNQKIKIALQVTFFLQLPLFSFLSAMLLSLYPQLFIVFLGLGITSSMDFLKHEEELYKDKFLKNRTFMQKDILVLSSSLTVISCIYFQAI